MRAEEEVFSEDFESGWSNWSVDNGVWEIGEPASGPGSAHEGVSAAGTNLGGNYPHNTDSRLISPTIALPEVGANELLMLRFWQWYSYSTSDQGQVQISIWDGSNWSDWSTLIRPALPDTNSGWSQVHVNLTNYAGQQIKFAFYHMAACHYTCDDVSSGWYIDNIEMSHFIPKHLTLENDINGVFSEDGERHYYTVSVSSGGHLQITLDDLDDSGIIEVYVSHGSLPTPGNYDYCYSNLGGADQEVFIPSATPGSWYILVYVDSVGENGDYTIQTEFSTGIILDDITPNQAGNTAPATITIDGAGFEPATEVALVQGETIIPADEVTYISGISLLAEFDLNGVAPGSYQLRVSSGEQSEEIPFEVLDGGSAKFETNLIVPSSLGYHNVATIWIEYANTGEVAMSAPLLVVTATQNDYYHKIQLDK